ncbi:MAG: adenylosuccinate lyase [Bacteroidetes bacterium]|nr:adenylosuccinate lyase [Bacteroidota bacterium]
MDLQTYHSPLSFRYASPEMSHLFSPQFKYGLWRKLWVALAKGQKQCGLPINEAQIRELEAHVDLIPFDAVAEIEKKLHHDVMAHIHAYGNQCPSARGIIHLGATSCYVTDNGDLLQMREGLKLIRNQIIQILRQLRDFSLQYAALPTLSYTHFQAAQPTTVGKRACLWLQDLLMDLRDIEHVSESLEFLGVKGATGTQASFLSLFGGDHKKVQALEQYVAKEMGFERVVAVAGQTYTRKQDVRVTSCLANLASSAHKLATDLRLLAHLKEIEEPFSVATQIGSSAMPYKRNPMRCERVCGLARFAISLQDNALYTEATQWLERSLDDSSNRRLYIPEIFLCIDAILSLLRDITAAPVVHPKIIEKHLLEEMPFLITEELLMAATKRGKDRQQVHERLRIHSLEAARRIKEAGLTNDLLERIAADSEIGLSKEEIQSAMDVQRMIGRSVEQVHEFLDQQIASVFS